MTRAAVYTRISNDPMQDAKGVARQRPDCLALCQRKGWDVQAVYEDNDISAAGAAKHRPQYEAMLAAVRGGEIDAVVAYSNSRLSRRPAEWLDLITLANSGKIEIATCVSGSHDLTTADGRAVALTVAVWDAAEAERTAERIKRQQLQHAQAGRKHQGRFRTYGYKRDMTVIAAEAAVIKDVFIRRAKGESLTALAIDMNSRGLKTTGGRDWDASAVTKLIQRRDYIGEITIKGEVVGKAAFDAIVDKPVFDLANQKVEEANNRGNNARVSLLAGFVVCGKCHTKMKQGGTKDGPYYRCPGKPLPGSCGSCSITAAQTDTHVFNAAWRKEQESEPPAKDGPVRDFASESHVLNTEIAQAQADFDSGALAYADLVNVLDTLRKHLGKVEREEAAMVSVDLGHAQMLLDWTDWNLSQQRLWLEKYLAFVVVAKAERKGIKGYKPERVTIHYKDGKVEQLQKRGTLTTW